MTLLLLCTFPPRRNTCISRLHVHTMLTRRLGPGLLLLLRRRPPLFFVLLLPAAFVSSSENATVSLFSPPVGVWPRVYLRARCSAVLCTCSPTPPLQLNIVTFLAKRLFDTTKVAQAGNAGVPFKKVLEEARFLSLPLAKVWRLEKDMLKKMLIFLCMRNLLYSALLFARSRSDTVWE